MSCLCFHPMRLAIIHRRPAGETPPCAPSAFPPSATFLIFPSISNKGHQGPCLAPVIVLRAKPSGRIHHSQVSVDCFVLRGSSTRIRCFAPSTTSPAIPIPRVAPRCPGAPPQRRSFTRSRHSHGGPLPHTPPYLPSLHTPWPSAPRPPVEKACPSSPRDLQGDPR